MIIDYKRELETAARNMIMVHDPDTLIRMTIEMICEKVKVGHASFLLNKGDSYVLSVSRGSLSSKVPVGMARLDKEDPLAVFFKRFNDKVLFKRRAVLREEVKEVLRGGAPRESLKTLLGHLLRQMELFDSALCVPAYFREDLLGILLLGKKPQGEGFADEELDFFIALASHLAMAIRNAQLFSELESELEKKEQLFVRTTIALAAAIEAKDHYTHGHTSRVANLSLEIARKITEQHKKQLAPAFFEDLHIASLLHDIGKIGVPEHILNKAGPLTEEERTSIRKHPMIGVGIIKPIKELEGTLPGVRYHHERYDGTGYPEGLKGAAIPLMASIISVADAFDAMVTDRPYRRRLSRGDALEEIKQLSGRQFDPRVTGALFELSHNGKI